MRVIPHYQPKRKRPWEARWYVDRRLKCRFFETEKERDQFIRNFSKELNAHGEEVFKFDKEQMREWQKASIILPHVSPMELVEFWLDHHEDIPEVTLSEAFAAYLKTLEHSGNEPGYLRHAKLAYERFTRFCSDGQLHNVTTNQVLEFIHGRPYADQTKNHHRSACKCGSRGGHNRINNLKECLPPPTRHCQMDDVRVPISPPWWGPLGPP